MVFSLEGSYVNVVSDVTPPVFRHCPEETIYLDFLKPAHYREPIATDNSGGLRSVTTDNDFRPGDTLQTLEIIIYRAIDYAGLEANCTVTLVPKGMNMKVITVKPVLSNTCLQQAPVFSKHLS